MVPLLSQQVPIHHPGEPYVLLLVFNHLLLSPLVLVLHEHLISQAFHMMFPRIYSVKIMEIIILKMIFYMRRRTCLQKCGKSRSPLSGLLGMLIVT